MLQGANQKVSLWHNFQRYGVLSTKTITLIRERETMSNLHKYQISIFNMKKCSRQSSWNRRATFLSGTSGNRVQTVFTTCVLWNTDALTHRKKDPEKCLHEAEQGKKKMYLETCLQKRRHFSSFVNLVDGLLGVEATVPLKRLSSRLATKWRQSYLKTSGYVKSTIAITLVHTTHTCIWGSRLPEHRISVHQSQWEYGVELNLFRWAHPVPLNQTNPIDTSVPRKHTMSGESIRQQRRREFREGGTGYTYPPLGKIHINSNINLIT